MATSTSAIDGAYRYPAIEIPPSGPTGGIRRALERQKRQKACTAPLKRRHAKGSGRPTLRHPSRSAAATNDDCASAKVANPGNSRRSGCMKLATLAVIRFLQAERVVAQRRAALRRPQRARARRPPRARRVGASHRNRRHHETAPSSTTRQALRSSRPPTRMFARRRSD